MTSDTVLHTGNEIVSQSSFSRASRTEVKSNGGEHEVDEPSPNNLAGILRWIGGAALVLSSVLYLWQGIDQIDAQHRFWVLLVLMSVLAAVGIISRVSFSDAKGARLSFALATALAPVQLAQVAGMLYQLMYGGEAASVLIWDFAGVTWANTGLLATLSALITLPIAHAGFSVLARRERGVLLVSYLVLCGLLLLPYRDSLWGFVVLAGMIAINYSLEKYLFRFKAAMQTKEAIGARLMLLIPLAIALPRMFFNADQDSELGLTALFMAFALIRGVEIRKGHNYFREFVLVIAALFVGLGWYFVISDIAFEIKGGPALSLLMLPMIACFVDCGRLSHSAKGLYLFLTLFAIAIPTVALALLDGESLHRLFALISAIGCISLGYLLRNKAAAVVGMALIFIAGAAILCQGLYTVEVNIWLGLAVIGSLVLIFASATERYGAWLCQQWKKGIEEFNRWD